MEVEDRRSKTIRGCKLHANSAYAVRPTPSIPVSANPAFEYGAPKLQRITYCSGISTMHHHINSIGGCIGRDCIADKLPDQPKYKMWVHIVRSTGVQSSSPVDTLVDPPMCEYLGSSAHRKRPSLFTSCTFTSLAQKPSR